MQDLRRECLSVNDLVGTLIKSKLNKKTLLDVLCFCKCDSESAEDIIYNKGWDIPHALFINEINDSDDKKFIKHIVATKKIIIDIICRNLIYAQFEEYEKINQHQLFTNNEKILRKMIKLVTYDIIMHQLYADGVIFYEPKVISMCVCIYIADLYPKKSNQCTILEKLFKKYNERQYVDVKLSDFEDEIIFVNKCDLGLTSFANGILFGYNMHTYRCFGKHKIYVDEILKIIENHLQITNMICLYQYFPTVNHNIYIWWVTRESISLPKEIVSIIVYNIIETRVVPN